MSERAIPMARSPFLSSSPMVGSPVVGSPLTRSFVTQGYGSLVDVSSFDEFQKLTQSSHPTLVYFFRGSDVHHHQHQQNVQHISSTSGTRVLNIDVDHSDTRIADAMHIWRLPSLCVASDGKHQASLSLDEPMTAITLRRKLEEKGIRL
ncbi:hypothetical protein PAPYR_4896 [Paratrimastix pyriformis]|uniref:Thioredoxin domain-containing protein n=1 Tax=Paratrimastix pyriformis TaxID=342808 RepID=A0ABQ8UN23_9EUKA|nr:hypothetical protein PAPYR_4896 [Paratrimastix pyriformis]